MKTTKLTPVFLSPNFPAGSRYAVAIAAQENGNSKAEPLIDSSKIAAIFGDGARSIAGVVNLIVDDLALHLQSGDSPDSWVPPVEGVTTGETVTLQDTPIGEALKVAPKLFN